MKKQCRTIVLINLIYLILARNVNNNIRNLNNKNNIKLKLIDDGDVSDNKCLKVFSGNKDEYPDSVYLNDEEVDLQTDGCISLNINDIAETYTVILEWNKPINTCEDFFYSLDDIVEIDLSEFDASEVTSMSSMFYYCKNLKNIKFGNINTSSLIEMCFMFNNCGSLYSIDLSNFDTSKVSSIEGLFFSCTKLSSLNITNMNTSQIINMAYIFYDANH